jgi:hypothetical protein
MLFALSEIKHRHPHHAGAAYVAVTCGSWEIATATATATATAGEAAGTTAATAIGAADTCRAPASTATAGAGAQSGVGGVCPVRTVTTRRNASDATTADLRASYVRSRRATVGARVARASDRARTTATTATTAGKV